jgi:hypothetical protein
VWGENDIELFLKPFSSKKGMVYKRYYAIQKREEVSCKNKQ